MRNWIPLLILALICGSVQADEKVFFLPKQTMNVGINIDVPANAKILKITATNDNGIPFDLYLKDGEDFVSTNALQGQSDYSSNNNGGSASLAIGTYAAPPLHQGRWHVALANFSHTRSTTVTLRTSTSSTAKVPTDFQINFGKASEALETAFGSADDLDCNVGPWSDSTALGNTTLGQFRQDLLKDSLNELSTQIHSPVPVHVQACWKEFDDSGEHAGSYTLAAAQGTYPFLDDQGLPLPDTWYAMAPAERLGGRRACKYYSDIDCSIPEVIVWFNSADDVSNYYDSVDDEPLIRTVTMHEIVHGLGFLSQVDVRKEKTDGTDNPDYLHLTADRFGSRHNDAYTVNVGYAAAPDDHPFDYTVTTFADLSTADREKALTSGQFLVWNDPALSTSSQNVLRNNTPPRNLVELHAPSIIQPGSTLSHLSSVHSGQLMTAVIQGNYPQTLGLAGPMLARVGWNTTPLSLAREPVPGNWYDPAHSGHGIDLEPIARDAAGDLYAVIFYTYDSQGKSEYYYAGGRYRDGHFESAETSGKAAGLGRPIYDPSKRTATYPDGAVGSLDIDFTASAANDAACAGRSGADLALMQWSIGSKSGTWCISPLVGSSLRPAANEDLNGLWNAGSSDSGWGMSVTEAELNSGTIISPYLLYYYDSNNQPRWAQAELGNYTPGQEVSLYDIHGYCRTCSKVPTTHQAIGTMRLGLDRPEHADLPSGDNTITVGSNMFGGISFQRTNTALRMYSLPAGK